MIVLICVGSFLLLILAVGIIVVVLQMKYTPMLIPTVKDATQSTFVSAKKLPLAFRGQGVSLSFSFWIYIKDWNYQYGNEKSVMNWIGRDRIQNDILCKDRKETAIEEFSSGSVPDGLDEIVDLSGSPPPENEIMGGIRVSLGEFKNTINIEFLMMNGLKDKMVIGGIPLQKWLSISIVLEQRNLDVFINGTLMGSLLLSNMPVYETHPLYICPNGGFLGYISKFQYYNRTLSIGEIQATMRRGPTSKPPSSLEFKKLDAMGSYIKEDVSQISYFYGIPTLAPR